nr:immunoglobulin light chain junction region [Macaca mulatta]MOX86225.1 immunoglobulin light chain junction region [Macaca mulatta]MOX87579.1 immunoglobulin light chain junction region [Macaca mulatta]MOX88625.1 immunoglobulin light chain junction region [Macaca mulatta]
CLQDKELPLTF